MRRPYYKLVAKPNRDGKHAITMYAYTNEGQFRRSISDKIGVYVAKEAWDEDTMSIKGKKNHTANQLLTDRLARAYRIIVDYDVLNMHLSHEQFWKEVNGTANRESFLEYYEMESARNYERRQIGKKAYQQELRTLRKLKEWKEQIIYSMINRKFVEEYDAWHAKQFKNSSYDGITERRRSLIHIYKYLNRAKADGIQFTWPFTNFRWPPEKQRLDFLTEDEVTEMMEVYEDPDYIERSLREIAEQRYTRSQDITQFCSVSSVIRVQEILRRMICMCLIGVRYSDAMRLRWEEHILEDDEYLVFTPKKTKDTSGKRVRMLLTEVHKKWFWGPRDLDGYLIKKISDQKFNKQLKLVAEMMDIKINLTTHVARHTFATMYLRRGGHIQELQRLMGLSSIDTVMKYVHVTDASMDAGMRKVFGKW
ncbi:MAG: tyrosine-type recombinase/integrase [Bacteroidota bacterium]